MIEGEITQRVITHHSYVLKKFDDCRVEEVVAVAVGDKCLTQRPHVVSVNDVPVVGFIFESDYSPYEPDHAYIHTQTYSNAHTDAGTVKPQDTRGETNASLQLD